jgi:anaerobic selenocysteine-containing dehydrogenase
VEVEWESALAAIGKKLASIQAKYGRDAVAVYLGNPVTHDYGTLLYALLLLQTLSTRNFYSANSVDTSPRLLASQLLYGSPTIIPVPDLDRTSFWLILGANPAVSNGSAMAAPDVKARLRGIKERGGRVVVVDPRRTETADLADEHVFIRPGTDAFLLLGMLHTLFRDNRIDLGMLSSRIAGLHDLREAITAFSPERVAPVTAIAASKIVDLARSFATARPAACYSRIGACTQEFGTLASWLTDVVNLVTGNLDRPGGAMFATPAADPGRLLHRLGLIGNYARWGSRVAGLPELNGELPVAALADEIETPGSGQIRALITIAGNPVLSCPNGKRLEPAFDSLDLMVSLDLYRNETTRHAHYLLPTSTGLERDHFPLLAQTLSVRNMTKYSRAILIPPPRVRHGWEILLEIAARLRGERHGQRWVEHAIRFLGSRVPPRTLLDGLLRVGPRRLSVRALEAAPNRLDHGPLEPRIAELLGRRKIDLLPPRLRADLDRARVRLDTPNPRGLVLIGRRQLRSNNSWMHNTKMLARGKPRCTLLVHPTDAAGVRTGDVVRVRSQTGSIEVVAEVSDEVMPGVVSLPHGWGHVRPGTGMHVAEARPGASLNDVTDETSIDPVSGCAAFAVSVELEVTAQRT